MLGERWGEALEGGVRRWGVGGSGAVGYPVHSGLQRVDS